MKTNQGGKSILLSLPAWAVSAVLLLTGGQALADDSGCSISGGGSFETVNSSIPNQNGETQFGGRVAQTDCSQVTENINGAWFVTFADGSRFQATDFESMAVYNGGVLITTVIGWGIYDGEIGKFILQAEDPDATGASGPDHIILDVYNPDDNTDILADARGDVLHGAIRIHFGLY